MVTVLEVVVVVEVQAAVEGQEGKVVEVDEAEVEEGCFATMGPFLVTPSPPPFRTLSLKLAASILLCLPPSPRRGVAGEAPPPIPTPRAPPLTPSPSRPPEAPPGGVGPLVPFAWPVLLTVYSLALTPLALLALAGGGAPLDLAPPPPPGAAEASRGLGPTPPLTSRFPPYTLASATLPVSIGGDRLVV